jgi:hypothetical protein
MQKTAKLVSSSKSFAARADVCSGVMGKPRDNVVANEINAGRSDRTAQRFTRRRKQRSPVCKCTRLGQSRQYVVLTTPMLNMSPASSMTSHQKKSYWFVFNGQLCCKRFAQRLQKYAACSHKKEPLAE